jgi:hypothetical protein
MTAIGPQTVAVPTVPARAAKAIERDLLTTWMLWVALSAATPVIGLVRDVLMQRNFGAHFPGQVVILLFLLILATAAPAVLQWLVLRRSVDRSPSVAFASLYVLSAWGSGVIMGALYVALQKTVFDGERAFDIARIRQVPNIVDWLQLAGYFAWTAFVANAAPLIVFGWFAKRSALVFLACTVAGACLAALTYKITAGFPFRFSHSFGGVDYSYANGPWGALLRCSFHDLFAGAVQGIISGYGLMRMLRKQPAAGA